MVKVMGLTGGIATGKSTVSSYLRKWGYQVVDADDISHQAFCKDNPCYLKILEHFHTVDRKKLAEIVFHQPQEKAYLESIIHPYVYETIVNQIKTTPHQIIFLDVPLLFETHFDELCDETIVVSCDKDIQLERLMKRNQLTQKEALLRIQAQMPLVEKKKRATYILNNNGDLETLKKNLEKLLEEVKNDL